MATDTEFANVSLLLPCDGTNGSTSFPDSSIRAKSVTATSATVSTAQSKFGGASLTLNGTSGRLSVPSHADLTFGTGDFTIEFWVRPSDGGHGATSARIVQIGANSAEGALLIISAGTNNPMKVAAVGYFSGAYVSIVGTGLVGNGTVANDAWTHIALCRLSGVCTLYIGGAVDASATPSPARSFAAGNLYIGSNDVSGENFKGYLDEIRITKGVARYTGIFTPPAAPFEANRLGYVATPGPLAAPHALGGTLVTGLVAANGPLGAPRALSRFVHAAYIAVPSVLGQAPPAALAVHDFSALFASSVSQYLLDVTTPGGVVRIPISSWQATLQAAAESYVQCVVPGAQDWAETLAEATSFQIVRYATNAGGDIAQAVIAEAPLQSLSLAQGTYNYSATLSGYVAAAPGPADIVRTLADRRTLFSYTSGFRVRCAIDWILRPGHTAEFDGTDFPVRYVSYYVTDSDAFMDVGE